MGTARRTSLTGAITARAVTAYAMAFAALCVGLAAILFDLPNAIGFYQFAFVSFLVIGVLWFICQAVHAFVLERSAKTNSLKGDDRAADTGERTPRPSEH